MASGGSENKEEPGAASDVPVQPEKHPLQNKWSLWYFKPDKSKAWKDNLKLVTSFDTVEDFWAVYNHIKPPSVITSGCDYMLFKEGIEPMWEDQRNKAGGRWLINFERGGGSRGRDGRDGRGDDRRDLKEALDNCWMETLMCLVGEGFEESSDEVCGAVVQIRPKADKIAIWTANSKKDQDILTIGRSFKDKLSMHMHRPSMVYQSHHDVASKSGSVSKSLHHL